MVPLATWIPCKQQHPDKFIRKNCHKKIKIRWLWLYSESFDHEKVAYFGKNTRLRSQICDDKRMSVAIDIFTVFNQFERGFLGGMSTFVALVGTNTHSDVTFFRKSDKILGGSKE